MKRNIIMIVVLLALFFLGLLIYDFSDELDSNIASHKWYSIEKESITVVDFKDRKFSYYYEETGEPVTLYELCTSFRFNRSINVIKLNCNLKTNKLYISKMEEDLLVINIEGEEKKFYPNEESALAMQFKENNNLTEEEFQDLMNTTIDKFNLTTVNNINDYYKSKKTKMVAFVRKSLSIQNLLNLKALEFLITSSNLEVMVLEMDLLNNEEFNSLKKMNLKDIDNSEETIYLYEIGNKKAKLINKIKIENYVDIKEYNQI